MSGLSIFADKEVILRCLPIFGFIQDGENYIYSQEIVEGQLKMFVRIAKNGNVNAAVYDVDTGDEYILHLTNAEGSFVGKVRKDYEAVLRKIADECFETKIFQSPFACEIVKYISEKYHNKFEFLWEKFPENAVVRRQDNRKWYAALLNVRKDKIKGGGEEYIEILDLRIKPEEIEKIVDGKRYFKGYHMNKKHWITICLDGTVSLAEIYKRIDESYLLAKNNIDKIAKR